MLDIQNIAMFMGTILHTEGYKQHVGFASKQAQLNETPFSIYLYVLMSIKLFVFEMCCPTELGDCLTVFVVLNVAQIDHTVRHSGTHIYI